MLATLLESEFSVDGTVVRVERLLNGFALVCSDGSRAEVRRWRDPHSDADMWALDVVDAAGVVTVAASSRKGADMISIESEEDSSMIVTLMEYLLNALRFGWWTYTVVVWDAAEGVLKLVHREEVGEYAAAAVNILSVGGKRYDEEEGNG